MNWKDTHLFRVSNSLWKFLVRSTGIFSMSLLFYFLKKKICSKQQKVNNLLILSSKYWTFCYNAFFFFWFWHFINSFNPPNNPKEFWMSPFYKWGSGGRERPGSLLKVAWLLSGRVRIWIQVVWLQSPCC